jgi:hypothetical protein
VPPTPTARPVGRPRKDRQDLGREFVVGARFPFLTPVQTRVLLPPFDDITEEFGDDVYQRMLGDDQVSACMTIYKAAILEEGFGLLPGVDENDPNYKKSVEIRDACVTMLENLEPDLESVLWDMLDAAAFGSRVAEQVYDYQDVDGETRLNLVKLKPKPRTAVAFAVDKYMNVVGLLVDKNGMGLHWAGLQTVDPKDLLPTYKFLIVSHRPKNADPRGSSILRAAYKPWFKKQQMDPEHLRFMSIFAMPILVGKTPEDASDQANVDTYGNVIDAATGNLPQMVLEAIQSADTDDRAAEDLDTDANARDGRPTPEEMLRSVLESIRNGSVVAVPFGTDIVPIEAKGDGHIWLDQDDHLNARITIAILNQQLATGTGPNQGRAASRVHQDAFDTLIRQGKQMVVRTLRMQVLRPWVGYNWGPALADLAPVPNLGQTERRDLATMITAYSAAKRAGLIHVSQLPSIDRDLGWPAREQKPGTDPFTGLKQTAHQHPQGDQGGFTNTGDQGPSDQNMPEGPGNPTPSNNPDTRRRPSES